MALIDELKTKLENLGSSIREVEGRLPAHSVKPPIMTQLLELEDEYERVLSQIRTLSGQ